MDKTYTQGQIDALSTWGRACGKQGNCNDCPVGTIRGANVTCQDFARQFPAKFLSMLTEMDQETISYYNEFCTRFPYAAMDLDVLSACMCRKAVFEGYLKCDKADVEGECEKCWSEPYTADVTMSVEE